MDSHMTEDEPHVHIDQPHIHLVHDSQPRLVQTNLEHNQIQREHCFAFFASAIATLAVTLSQVPSLLITSAPHEADVIVGGLIDSSSLSRCRSRRNYVSMWYICVMYQFLVLHNQVRNPRQINCEWYIKPRARQWFVLFLVTMPMIDPERFCQFFRISPNLFLHIFEMVHDDIVTDPPEKFRILPNRVLIVQRQVGLALLCLCTGDHYVVVAEFFGVSKSSAIKVTWKFIQALNRKAAHHLRWPDAEGLARVKAKFLEHFGFPNCCGAVDSTHFPIELPADESSVDYFDYKRNISVSLQAIVDQDLRFMHVVAGWPASIQDSRLLRRSKFFASVVYREERLNGPVYITEGGQRIKEYILGDGGYPLYDWLIVPYPQGRAANLTLWNHWHSSARMCMERAFGRLKGTWRILSRILFKPKLDRIGPLIYSCCVLHNMIINREDGLNPAVYQGAMPHPEGYGEYARQNRARFAGGPEAREVLLTEVPRAKDG